ncbi:hypothetical protein GCM10011316_38590 [Roseibium aquae]|uniref:RecA-family ATPase n=1 Tax=Roseibium aquae TaxID=1323746 RepID=A0A916TN87_9HYPH|nr:AAA family ATPase [Roseibium aquae]GGB62978.1 hypothetical protein GCM10011316_38590 [Roseibium aquae]
MDDLGDVPFYSENLIRLEETQRGRKWAQKALRSECETVAKTLSGGRNDALNIAAVKLGHKIAAGYLTRSEVEEALEQAASDCGLLHDDGLSAVRATIKSGLEAGLRDPQHPQERPEYASHGGRQERQERPEPRQSKFFSAADLAGRPVPDREWLVKGLVPQNTVTLFSGDGGTGKSLLSLQMAVAAATGTRWLGHAVKQGPAIFMSAEDDEGELHRRLDDILTAEMLAYDQLEKLTIRSLAGEDALLALEDKYSLVQSALFHELDQRAVEDAPGLIVLDTCADLYPSNENDRAKVRQFVGILRGLALKHQCAVVLLSHPSLTGRNSGTGESGSTAWNNSVRSRLYLQRLIVDGYEPNTKARTLSVKKANYGSTGGQISLQWEAGRFVAEAEPTGMEKFAQTAKAERVFLKLLDLMREQGRTVNAKSGGSYAPSVFASHPDCEGISKRAFRNAMEALLARGDIVTREHGSPSRRVSYLARPVEEEEEVKD